MKKIINYFRDAGKVSFYKKEVNRLKKEKIDLFDLKLKHEIGEKVYFYDKSNKNSACIEAIIKWFYTSEAGIIIMCLSENKIRSTMYLKKENELLNLK